MGSARGNRMMIESVEFHNFKALRDAKLPLSRFTLIVGPNGSGKSTAIQALQEVGKPMNIDLIRIITAGIDPMSNPVSVTVNWGEPFVGVQTVKTWLVRGDRVTRNYQGQQAEPDTYNFLDEALAAIRIYS